MARAQREHQNHADQSWEGDPPRDHKKWPDKLMAEATAEIMTLWQPKTIEVFIKVGRRLIETKLKLKTADPPGQFLLWIKTDPDLPFGEDTAQRLMKIAAHPWLSNTANWRYLPPYWRTLSELARLSPEQCEEWRLRGYIHPEMQYGDAAAAVTMKTKGEPEDRELTEKEADELTKARRAYVKCLKTMSTKCQADELSQLFKLVMTPAEELVAERMVKADRHQAAADSMAALHMGFDA